MIYEWKITATWIGNDTWSVAIWRRYVEDDRTAHEWHAIANSVEHILEGHFEPRDRIRNVLAKYAYP